MPANNKSAELYTDVDKHDWQPWGVRLFVNVSVDWLKAGWRGSNSEVKDLLSMVENKSYFRSSMILEASFIFEWVLFGVMLVSMVKDFIRIFTFQIQIT